MTYTLTLGLMDRYQQQPMGSAADLIAEAAPYGDQVQRDLIMLIAHHLQLTGHVPDPAVRELLDGDLDALQVIDPDD